MPNNQNHSGQAVTVMHITDAARIFHSFLLENHPDGLMENQMKQFYASEPQAGNRIRKRGLHQFIKEYSHLFSLIGDGSDGENGEHIPILIRAKSSAKKVELSERQRMEKLALSFYNDRLQGRALLLKRCTDRTQFTQELYQWKDGQRRTNMNLRGTSPASIIRALVSKKLNKLELSADNQILIWKELSAASGSGSDNNGSRAKTKTREERVKEAVDRVREARGELEKNRDGISVDFIDFNIAEGDVVRPLTEIAQSVKITNRSRKAVRLRVQDEIASRRGLEVDGEKEVLIPGGGAHHIVRIKYLPKNIGLVNTIISFEFIVDSKIFAIVRYISVRCGDPDDHAILKPTSKYEKKKSMEPGAFQKPVRVERDKVATKKFAVPLKPYYIPSHVRDAIVTKTVEDLLMSILYDGQNIPPDELPSNISSALTLKNYARFFETLLWVEESQMSIDIRNYDLKNVSVERRGRFYCLLVPGLAEARPSVLRGDTITLRISDQAKKSFAGIVQMIECENAIIQFHKSFDRIFVSGMKFDVRFSYSRTGLRVCHQSLTSAVGRNSLLNQTLFPSPLDQRSLHNPLEAPARINFMNRELNSEQQAAVRGVLEAVARPSPYLIFGPPGTGKTVTLVEAIIQTAKANPSSRILVCAPSNTATDLIVQRLAPYFGTGEMIRLLAFTRDRRTVPNDIMNFCYFSESDNAFISPPQDVVQKKRIVAVTVASGGKLPNDAIADHFTHVFADEAGHAIEPMALSCFADVTKKSGSEKPVVVLAGDPKQLGPIIRSAIAKDFGLSKSLLERLCECSPYQRRVTNHDGATVDPYDSRVMTKLVKNYRSHPAILKLPNELFYDGDLIPSADQFKVNSLVNWEHLPQKGFPVVFHGVKGSDEREGNSPSWFNPEEVQIVKEYVGLLVRGTRSNRVKPEEIAVITPYQKQAQKIRMLLKSHDYGDIKVGSVDEFQGSERRVVIISTVRSTKEYLDFDAKHQLGFLSNPKRFNVAITRAQALLIVIGNPVVLEEDNNWSSFVRYCFTNKGYTGVDFKPDTNRKKEYDAGIDGAISGIVNMSLHSKVDDSDDTDDFVMVSNTTAQEGPAWRMEE